MLSNTYFPLSLAHFLPVHLNANPLQRRIRVPRRQERLRVLVEERPRRNDDQERESGAAEADVERLIDVLRREADKECYCADDGEEAVGDVFGESLAFEVL